jgi:hypothetical protein
MLYYVVLVLAAFSLLFLSGFGLYSWGIVSSLEDMWGRGTVQVWSYHPCKASLKATCDFLYSRIITPQTRHKLYRFGTWIGTRSKAIALLMRNYLAVFGVKGLNRGVKWLQACLVWIRRRFLCAATSNRSSDWYLSHVCWVLSFTHCTDLAGVCCFHSDMP